jgi:hypothetical protein
MAGWTKADYDNAYRIRVERRYGTYPAGATRPEVRAHYHRWAMKDHLDNRWSKMLPVLAIDPSEFVCIVGAGFGWGVESFANRTGCVTCGIDISDYISAEQDNTEEAELRQCIIDGGLDPDTGDGAFLLSQIYDAAPRKDPSIIVLQEDMQTNTSRQNIRAALGNNWPSVVIFEDLIDDNTLDAEITQANNAANLFAGNQRVIWVTAKDRPGRTLQQLQTLTGSEVITVDGLIHLVP